MKLRFLTLLVVCAPLFLAGLATGQTIFSVNAEGPTYSAGPLDGQDGWYGPFGYQTVSTAYAHSGTQSISTQIGDASRLFDVPSMDLGPGTQWWMDTWAYFPSGDGDALSSFTLNGSVVYAFGIYVTNAGVVTLSGGYNGFFDTRNLGSAVLDQWVHLRIEQLPVPGNGIRLSIVGTGVNESFDTLYATSGAPTGLVLSTRNTPSGIAYWDDITVGYGPVAVPEPSSLMLLTISAIGLALAKRRRR